MRYVPAHEIKENIGSYDIEDIHKADKNLHKRWPYRATPENGIGWLNAGARLVKHIVDYKVRFPND